jgi:hypothetical protein
MSDTNEKDFLIEELLLLESNIFLFLNRLLSANRNNALIIFSTDFNQLLNDAGLNKVVNKLEGEYTKIVSKDADIAKSLNVTIPRNLDALQFLMETDADILLNDTKNFTNQLKKKVLTGFADNLSSSQILSLMSETKLTQPQLLATLNTAQSQFRAASMATLFQDAPEVRFRLAHVMDNRNRCQCRAVYLNQNREGYTKAEIDKGAWTKLAREFCPKFDGEYSFINRGGWNCRGFIQVVK